MSRAHKPRRGGMNMRRHFFVAATMLALASSASVLAQTPAPAAAGGVQGVSGAEPCKGSTVCAWSRERDKITHEFRKPDLAFKFEYPFALPEGGGGVAAVAINSKG